MKSCATLVMIVLCGTAIAPAQAQNLFRTSPRPSYARVDAVPRRTEIARYAEGIGRTTGYLNPVVTPWANAPAAVDSARLQAAWAQYQREVDRFQRRQAGYAQPVANYPVANLAGTSDLNWTPNADRRGHVCRRGRLGARVPADYAPRLDAAPAAVRRPYAYDGTDTFRPNVSNRDVPRRYDADRDAWTSGHSANDYRTQDYRSQDYRTQDYRTQDYRSRADDRARADDVPADYPRDDRYRSPEVEDYQRRPVWSPTSQQRPAQPYVDPSRTASLSLTNLLSALIP